MPGYDPEPNSTDTDLRCTVVVLEIGPCKCNTQSPNDRSFLNNDTWYYETNQDEYGIRCTNLCKSNNQVGAPIAIPQEWHDNNVWKQLSFYKKELTVASEKRRHNHLIERLDEFSEGFSSWHYLNNTHLGDVIEFGAGGYTQTRNILERTTNVDISSIVLLDPMLPNYKKIQSCPFQSGSLEVNGKSYKTKLEATTVEEFGRLNKLKETPQQYDTVICMNVLVYARNAFKFLETLYHSVKPGGLLLFHDRWFEDPATSSQCRMSGFLVNIIQVKKIMLDHFLSKFELASGYVNTNQTAGQRFRQQNWCPRDNERAYFVAVRKPK